MRRVLFWVAIGFVAIVISGVLWLKAGRPLSLAFDHLWTPRVAALTVSPFGWNGVWLQFGPPTKRLDRPFVGALQTLEPDWCALDLDGPGPNYERVATISVDPQGRLALTADGQSFVIGIRAGTIHRDDEDMPAFAAELGDTAALVIDRSLFGWPTPFNFSFMPGTPATWRRHVYYRLSWTKASGARLHMLWRFEQGYDGVNGWRAPGDDGLMQITIVPPPAAARGADAGG